MAKQPSDGALWIPELYSSPGKACESDTESISLEKRHWTGCYSFASAGGGKWEGAGEGRQVLQRKSCPATAPSVSKLRLL